MTEENKPKGRAAVFRGYGQPFTIEEVEIPQPKGEQVVVRTAGCGLCHTDLHIWLGELPGVPEKVPSVLGHEPSGYVAAKGDAVPDRVKIGMPVLVQGGYYLEDDIYTLKGLNQMAVKKSQSWTGAYGLYGGCYAEYFLVPSYRYLVSAEGLDDLAAAAVLTDAGLTPYRAVKTALKLVGEFAEPGDVVVAVGVGGLGSFGVQWANVLAPHLDVVAVDAKEEALEFARKVGKIYALVDAKRGDPAKAVAEAAAGRKIVAVLDFVGAEQTISKYIDLLSPEGVYVVVGLGGVRGSFPIADLVINEKKIVGSLWGSVADLTEVVDYARRRAVNYGGLVTKRWKLDEINEAFQAMRRGQYVGRMVVAP
ncbi:alcohol dehydrogenase [Thermoproteus uzoniensis 768-20]|uniref:Alcohol dehydrogenase n=1 Tax=Thermoproteus uzoniensis (strain 768-20) TaxID=999630 RepID=F2L135_THEU7|nr:zinc-binding dehydrogenase [Thermoproteus uzoniensis]AEA11584.1 alcohol dehydrogenase [Thermoproteus uzoniensis 768-20]